MGADSDQLKGGTSMPFVLAVAVLTVGILTLVVPEEPFSLFNPFPLNGRHEEWGNILWILPLLLLYWPVRALPLIIVGVGCGLLLRAMVKSRESQAPAILQIPIAAAIVSIGTFYGSHHIEQRAEAKKALERVVQATQVGQVKQAEIQMAAQVMHEQSAQGQAQYITSCNFSASGDLIEVGASDGSTYMYGVESGALIDLHQVQRVFDAATALQPQHRIRYDAKARTITMGDQEPVVLHLNSPALHFVGMGNPPGSVVLFDDEERAAQMVDVASRKVLWSEPINASFQDSTTKTWSSGRAWNLFRAKDAQSRSGYYLLINDMAALGLSEVSRQAGFPANHRVFFLDKTLNLRSKPGPAPVGGVVELRPFSNDAIEHLIQRKSGSDLYFTALGSNRLAKSFALDLQSGTDRIPSVGGWSPVADAAKTTDLRFSALGFGQMSKLEFEDLWKSMAFTELATFFDGSTLFPKPGEKTVFAYRPGEGYAAVGAEFGQRAVATERRCVALTPDARKIAIAVGPYLQVFVVDEAGRKGIGARMIEVPINGRRALELITQASSAQAEEAETVLYEPPVFADTAGGGDTKTDVQRGSIGVLNQGNRR